MRFGLKGLVRAWGPEVKTSSGSEATLTADDSGFPLLRPRFPSNPLTIRVPLFLLFGLNTLGLQIAQSRYCLQTLEPKVGNICILGALGIRRPPNKKGKRVLLGNLEADTGPDNLKKAL